MIPFRENSLTSTFVSVEPAWLWWTGGIIVLVLAVLVCWVWYRGRPFAQGQVFHASRLSRGNRLFPTQVLITPSSVVQYTARWIGRQEESIHIAHISSVKIKTGLMLSDVLIETSGGASPIVCHGHTKSDAVKMKNLIEQSQNAYYRAGTSAPNAPASPPAKT